MSGLLTCCGITCFGSVLPLAGYLLAGPRTQGLGSATFHPRLYTCLGRAYRTAYLRAFPDASTRSADMSRVSAHFGRKSLSQ